MRLSDKIVMLRKKQGWSQEELANQLDVSRQAIYKWESALTTPELEKIRRLTELFNVTFEELLNDEKEIDFNKEDSSVPRVEEQRQEAPVEEPIIQENVSEKDVTGQEQEKSLSPNGRGKLLAIIAIAVGALVTAILIFSLIFRSCEASRSEESSSSESSSSQSEVVGANCIIQIKTGTSEDNQYRVKLVMGNSFTLEIPDQELDCVTFKGYFTEDGKQITDSEGDSVVSWQGEQRYVLVPHYDYKIKTVSDLVSLQSFAPVRRQDTYKGVTITLENDLDLSSVENWEPLRIYPCFDGKGHKIKNLTSTKGGLFGDIYGTGDKYIKNLTLENVSISITEVKDTSSTMYVGALAGWFQGNIEDVTISSGSITIAGDIDDLVQYGYDGLCCYARKIENSESRATVKTK